MVLDVAVTHSHIPELSSLIHEIISQFYMDLLHKKMHESPEIFWNIIKDSFSILGKEIHRCEQLDNAILMLAEVIGSINMSNQDGMKKKHTYQINRLLFDSVVLRYSINVTDVREGMRTFYANQRAVMEKLDNVLSLLSRSVE